MRILETHGGVVPVFIPGIADQGSIATSGTSNSVTLNGAYIVRLHATKDCYVNFGDSTVTASASDMPMDAGTEVFGVPSNTTYIAAIQNSAAGTLTVTPIES